MTFLPKNKKYAKFQKAQLMISVKQLIKKTDALCSGSRKQFLC